LLVAVETLRRRAWIALGPLGGAEAEIVSVALPLPAGTLTVGYSVR